MSYQTHTKDIPRIQSWTTGGGESRWRGRRKRTNCHRQSTLLTTVPPRPPPPPVGGRPFSRPNKYARTHRAPRPLIPKLWGHSGVMHVGLWELCRVMYVLGMAGMQRYSQVLKTARRFDKKRNRSPLYSLNTSGIHR